MNYEREDVENLGAGSFDCLRPLLWVGTLGRLLKVLPSFFLLLCVFFLLNHVSNDCVRELGFLL